MGKCTIIKKATEWIADKSCLVAMGDGTAACEIAGLGPEDPWADGCAILMDAAIAYSCHEYGSVNADAILKHANCQCEDKVKTKSIKKVVNSCPFDWGKCTIIKKATEWIADKSCLVAMGDGTAACEIAGL